MTRRAEIVGFISIKGGVGKTTVASNVAYSLANDMDKRVLLVDGNFSAPTLNSYFNVIDCDVGLGEVLAGKARIQNVIRPVLPNLHLLPVHYYNSNVDPKHMRQALCSLRSNYDFIVIDSSPALNEETLAAIHASDRLFMITTPDHVTLGSTMRAVKIAKDGRTPISGIVINKLRGKHYEIGAKEVAEVTGIPVVSSYTDNDKVLRSLSDGRLVNVNYPKADVAHETRRLSYALCGKVYKPYGLFSSIGNMFSKRVSQANINRSLLNSDFY